MQLRLDAADRLVELVEERRGPVFAEEAARHLFALRQTPVGVARALLTEVVDDDSRLRWHGDAVALSTPAGADLALDSADYVVVDLETTGLRVAAARICEIGAVRIRRLEVEAEFQTLVDPREPLGAAVATLTGLSDTTLRGAPHVELAMRRFLSFAGDAVLVAHNARFDLAFLDRETERLTGRRIAAPVIDTVALARRLLADRVPRASLAQLSYFFGTSVQPCHRALPDAQATAEILLALLGLAQERGARTVADVVELAATRDRRAYAKRHLAYGAPPRPGVYLFRDRNEQVLYVGRARDLRARLRSYFRSQRQRPAVEAALGACERIDWHVVGSELEAALEELRLIRELRPPANARVTRPERYVYLKARGTEVVASKSETPLGPIRSRRRAQLAARALDAADLSDPRAALPRLQRRLAMLATAQRFEEAGRLRDRIAALEAVCRELDRVARARSAGRCVLCPAAEPGCVRAFFVAGGRVAATRTIRRAAGQLEVEAGLAATRRVLASDSAPELDELLLIESFLRRPPPELVVTVLDRTAILRALQRVAATTTSITPRAR